MAAYHEAALSAVLHADLGVGGALELREDSAGLAPLATLGEGPHHQIEGQHGARQLPLLAGQREDGEGAAPLTRLLAGPNGVDEGGR